jgi:hypothetical protein
MKKLVEWIADQILTGVKQQDMSAFTKALEERRDELTKFYHDKMWGMPERYAFTTGEMVILNADPDDPDVFYTLAKQAVNHLATSLISDEKKTI